MKDQFPWYFPPSEHEFWQDCTFVFDTNALLNLYRFTKESRDDFFGVLEQKVKNRIWIPGHVASEFLSKRPEVIQDLRGIPRKITDKLKASIKEIRQSSASEDWHVASVIRIVDERLDALSAELDKSDTGFSLQTDPVMDRIDTLTKGRIGPEYDETQLKEKLKDAKERADNRIPPGYVDVKEKLKGFDSSKLLNPNNAYGDLIIWHQIIDYCAAGKGKRIAFICNDEKEDWVHRTAEGVTGPRRELLEELHRKGNGAFLRIYRSARFLQLAKEKLAAKVDEKTIKEAQKVENATPRAFRGASDSVAEAVRLVTARLAEQDLVRTSQSRAIEELMKAYK